MPRRIALSLNKLCCLCVMISLSLLAPLSGFGMRSAYPRSIQESTAKHPLFSRLSYSAAPLSPAFSISPASGVQGREYEVLVTSEECLGNPTKNPVKDLQLRAPEGSGIRVTGSKATDCRLTARISIASDAPLGVIKLQLIDKEQVIRQVTDFTVAGLTPGPIPPGLNSKGEVDIMWSVLPDKITSDNFGGKVKRQFYCIEVTIGNNSGYDLQLGSIGFTLPGLENGGQRVPSTGYRTVRGSLEAFQMLAPRSFVINGLKVLGPLLTGFLPFFHVTSRARNFSEAINVISNPLEKGVESLWPDLTPRDLDRLADMTFRDDVSTKTIVPNNVQARIMTFVPKELVFPYKKKFNSSAGKDLSPDNPHDVMRALGEIVIVGQQVVHVNRVRVVSTGLENRPSDTTISGRITDVCNVGVGAVTVTLSGGQDFASRDVTTSPDGTYIFQNVPVGRTYTVAPKLENLTFTPESPQTFPLNDPRTNMNFLARHAVLVITGKIVDKDSKPVKDVSVSMAPAGLVEKDARTNEAGVFRFEIPGTKVTLPAASYQITPKPDKHTFDEATKTWKCDQRQLNFVATPKPSPSPSPNP